MPIYWKKNACVVQEANSDTEEDDYCNPNLGLVTKVKACKVASQEGSLGVTSHAFGSAKECEGMNPHTPK
jgi:hypothetical protein